MSNSPGNALEVATAESVLIRGQHTATLQSAALTRGASAELAGSWTLDQLRALVVVMEGYAHE